MNVEEVLYGMYERNEYAGTPESLALLDETLQQNQGAALWTDVDQGNTDLHYAAGMRLHGAVPVLVRHGFDPNARNFSGETPLYSIFGEHSESENTVRTASRLLDGGADPNAVNNRGESVVRCAAAGGYDDTIDLLLRRGAVLDLKAATRLGWVDAVEDILRRSDDPQRLIDTTPLLGDDAIHAHWGGGPDSRSKPYDTLRLLLDKGMSPNQKDAPNGQPLVICLTLESRKQPLEILLSYNVDINATIQRGNRTVTATDLAIDREDDEVVALLRTHGGKTYAELHPKRRK